MIVSNRTRRILELLLRSGREMTAAELAAGLQVSSRTVHRELAAVEDLLAGQAVSLVKKSGSGIALQGDPAALERLGGIVSASEETEFSPDERQIYLLCLLLREREPVKQFALAHELKVTVQTIGSDLEELAEWVERFGVRLIRRRGYGVELSGGEAELREAIRQLIRLRLDDAELIASRGEPPSHPLDRMLFELAGRADMADVESALWSLEGRWAGSLNEQIYTDLLIRLSISLHRVRQGKTVADAPVPYQPPPQDGQASERAAAEAAQLADQLSARPGVAIGPAETAYAAELLQDAHGKDLALLPGDDLALADAVRRLIRSVQASTGVDYDEDRSLRDGLFEHLKQAVQRLGEGQRIRNPLLGQIRRDYATLFAAVREAACAALPHLEVPDEEIGFLVMHFGASNERLKQLQRNVRAILVCTSGIGSSKLLQMRIRKELPQIEIADRVSWYEAARLDEDTYDLIISTIDLPIDARHYMKVSPLLTQGEADRLRAFVREAPWELKQAAVRKRETGSPDAAADAFARLQRLKTTLDEIVSLVGGFRVIELGEEASELHAALDDACRREEALGALSCAAAVRDRLLGREEQGSQMIPGTGLALFHTRAPEIKSSTLKLYRLRQAVRLPEQDDGSPVQLARFLLMLAPRALARERLEVLSEISAMLLDEETVALLEGGDETAIRERMTTHLRSFFLTKTESE
ncbi:mannitol operon transcriptional antiterminator [Cohnella sp. OV330]|uniref:BglG family transcription antiterminator n=1 Tax=Cohnella sp. OV330 TaxID=1855288 RepID=UPI0008EA4C93|nr:BglG family transcription antiterminator [Cohnella sp. OV330]SFB59238.1 mannitol operon transcriptional antiterminator [Cohnella sp. OV330]